MDAQYAITIRGVLESGVDETFLYEQAWIPNFLTTKLGLYLVVLSFSEYSFVKASLVDTIWCSVGILMTS